MKKAYLIYENKEAQKNHGFIEMFQQTGKEKGIDFSFVSKTDYQTFSEKINPDFVLNRTRDPEVSRWYEERNIPVYHNSRLVELANHKYKMMTYFQEHLPEKILNEKWGKRTVSLTITEQYRNMKEIIDTCMELIEHATAACKECNIPPLITPIRGGTDGAQLSFMGLPCPNLGTGGHAYHGPYEHITVEGMNIAVEVGLKIIELFYK